ncbi:UPAR/Ly6 domain-containing protein crim [Eurosta solidaginis]|uniref:UPAR/Ly6 domain-containing protein crim n=1 Tax=Eurosta solidaginis TaxID=178769 RepID=UPI0035313E30
MMGKLIYTILIVATLAVREGSAIWCYRCTSSTPGCGEKFNWRGIGFLGEQCPETNDICVKLIEKRGAQEAITRDCLSSLSFRTDIPADKYEGCRLAAKDVRLANYVNHTIKEHDVKRDYFNDVTFCFCFLDHRCNGVDGISRISSIAMVGGVSAVLLLARRLILGFEICVH